MFVAGGPSFVPATLCQDLVPGNLVPGNLVPGYLVPPRPAAAHGGTRSRHFAGNHMAILCLEGEWGKII